MEFFLSQEKYWRRELTISALRFLRGLITQCAKQGQILRNFIKNRVKDISLLFMEKNILKILIRSIKVENLFHWKMSNDHSRISKSTTRETNKRVLLSSSILF